MGSSKWKAQRLPKHSTEALEALSSDFPDYEVVEHKVLAFTNIDGGKTFGNNKFFSIELHKASNAKWRVYTNYHKVADEEYAGAFEVRGPATEQEMRQEFDRIFASKTKKRSGRDQYREIKFVKATVGSPKAREIVHKVAGEDAKVEGSNKRQQKGKKLKKKVDLPPEVARFVEQIYEESGSAIKHYVDVKITKDGLQTPIGILTPSQITEGKQLLGELNKLAEQKASEQEIRRVTNEYYSTIPHKLGLNIRNAVLDQSEQIQRELDILELMVDSLEVGTEAYDESTVQKYLDLGVEISIVPKKDAEYQRVYDCIKGTISSHHDHFMRRTAVRNVFRITLPSERQRFEKCSVDNQQELFHGSRCCNILGILNRGLLIAPPEAPVSGYAFGKGIYFADVSSKSLQYSMKNFGYQRRYDNCFLFLSKVKLGKQMTLDWGFPGYDVASRCLSTGHDSTFGKASPQGLRHNEFITYRLEQNTLTHVVELQHP